MRLLIIEILLPQLYNSESIWKSRRILLIFTNDSRKNSPEKRIIQRGNNYHFPKWNESDQSFYNKWDTFPVRYFFLFIICCFPAQFTYSKGAIFFSRKRESVNEVLIFFLQSRKKSQAIKQACSISLAN